jgi:hypothetical protein
MTNPQGSRRRGREGRPLLPADLILTNGDPPLSSPLDRLSSRTRNIPMNALSYFERLTATAQMIARHAYYPGKDQAVHHCIEDIEDLLLAGRITPEQRDVLRGVLLVPRSHSDAA